MMGGLSVLWTVALLAFNPNQDVLGDTISALGFSVCFYYGFTGLACAVLLPPGPVQERSELPLGGGGSSGGWGDDGLRGDQGLQLLQHGR